MTRAGTERRPRPISEHAVLRDRATNGRRGSKDRRCKRHETETKAARFLYAVYSNNSDEAVSLIIITAVKTTISSFELVSRYITVFAKRDKEKLLYFSYLSPLLPSCSSYLIVGSTSRYQAACIWEHDVRHGLHRPLLPLDLAQMQDDSRRENRMEDLL